MRDWCQRFYHVFKRSFNFFCKRVGLRSGRNVCRTCWLFLSMPAKKILSVSLKISVIEGSSLSQIHATSRLASIELSFHPCNIVRDNRRGVSRGNKNVGCGTWKWRFFALAVRITGKLLKIDGTCCETICKHRILFPSIQHLAWLPQGRPQGKPKRDKNSDFWNYALT